MTNSRYSFETLDSVSLLVISTFSKKQKHYVGKSASAEAQQFRDRQLTHWQSLLDMAFPDDGIRQLLRYVKQQLKDDIFRTQQVADGWVVYSPIPLLEPQDTNELNQKIAEADPYNSEHALLLAAALTTEAAIYAVNYQGPVSILLLTYVSRYMSGGATPNDIRQTLQIASKEISRVSDVANKYIGEAQSQFAEFSKSEKAELSSFKSALAESFNFSASSRLWRTKSRWHKAGYIFWFMAFASTLCVFVVLVYSRATEIIALVPKDKDGIPSYVGLVFFLVPVIGVAWLLRLISRFINNQQILGDDANQRDAMTCTYLALLANGKMDEKERVVMLNAIFRPLPGAQTEDVAPPTVLDLMKQAK